MITRAARSEDFEAIRRIHAESGFAYELPDLGSTEAIQIVVGDDDVPLMAVIAKRVVEVILVCPSKVMHPLVKMNAIKMLHSSMGEVLSEKGFTEANVFLAQEIEKSFGRHLVKKFGWMKNWPSLTIRNWKGRNG